jgi:predicted nuclease of predicted toxin-antitoxin system
LRLLANENVPLETVDALRRAGHDVTWLLEARSGSGDAAILATAQSEQRILLTFDKDFGELAFRARLDAATGIVLLRLRMPSPAAVTARVLSAIESRDDWNGHFSVIEDDRIRMTPLPDE